MAASNARAYRAIQAWTVTTILHGVLRAMRLVVLVVCATLAIACHVTAVNPYLVAVNVQNDGDQVTPSRLGDRLVLDIVSRTGIGAAQAAIVSETRPAAIELRLHLQGLEELRFTCGQRSVVVSVQSYDDRIVRQTVQVGNAAPEAITPDSPYWMDIAVSPSGTAAPAPLFVVQAPPDCISTQNRGFDLRWVDFYR